MLLPERMPADPETAMNWLRGAQAAMELLVGAAARTSTNAGHEVSSRAPVGSSGRSPFSRGQKARRVRE